MRWDTGNTDGSTGKIDRSTMTRIKGYITTPLRVGTWMGVPVLLHPTLLLGFFVACVVGLTGSMTPSAGLRGVGEASAWFVLLFGSVFLHEFGHVRAARMCKVGTFQVLMTPLGGVASLYSNGRTWKHDLWITVAGPLVNVIIAIIGAASIFGILLTLPFLDKSVVEVLRLLVLLNIGLALFNLLPIFPMDGGRIVRAILSAWIDPRKATVAAVWIARGSMIVIGVLLYRSGQSIGLLPLTAFVLWRFQSAELGTTRHASLLSGVKVRDVYTPLAVEMRVSGEGLAELDTTTLDTPLDRLWWDLTNTRTGISTYWVVENGTTIGALQASKIHALARAAKVKQSTDISAEPIGVSC